MAEQPLGHLAARRVVSAQEQHSLHHPCSTRQSGRAHKRGEAFLADQRFGLPRHQRELFGLPVRFVTEDHFAARALGKDRIGRADRDQALFTIEACGSMT